MKTAMYETISEFKPIQTGHTTEVAPKMSGIKPLTPKSEVFETKAQAPERFRPKDELLFAPTVDARVKIRQPFLVHLATADEGVSAYVDEIGEFGFGSNRGEALDDLAKTISELYFRSAAKGTVFRKT